MRLLLDTHIFLWWLADAPALPRKAREAISDGHNWVYVSAVSAWEISVKKSLGKLQAPGNIADIVEQERFLKLPITLVHGEVAGQLPAHHRDPFDRMLIAQAQCEGLALVTVDNRLTQYEVAILPIT